MDFANLFAEIATGVTALVGGPYYPGKIVAQETPGSYDIGGNFVPGSVPAQRDCSVQIDTADWTMRQSAGFVDGMVKFIILAASLEGDLDADATVVISSGPHAGEWLVSSLSLDTLSMVWVGRGLQA